MKTKILLSMSFFFFCFSFSFAYSGIGSSFSYSASTTPSSFVSFSARSDISPWCVFFNAHLEKKVISVFADDWFINERISEYLDYYVLWGISAGCRFEDNIGELATGCRFGAGLDLFALNRRLEFFAQTVWNPYFGGKKKDNKIFPLFRPVNFPCTAGFRVWF